MLSLKEGSLFHTVRMSNINATSILLINLSVYLHIVGNWASSRSRLKVYSLCSKI
jgi:hypothetical protein